MWDFLKKKSGAEIKFKINGMHCSNCSLTIDSELEDMSGVAASTTNYAQSVTTVNYDPQRVSPLQLKATIDALGYEAQEIGSSKK